MQEQQSTQQETPTTDLSPASEAVAAEGEPQPIRWSGRVWGASLGAAFLVCVAAAEGLALPLPMEPQYVRYCQLAVAAMVVLGFGGPLVSTALAGLARSRLTVELHWLISALAALIYSGVTVFADQAHTAPVYFDLAGVLTACFLLGRLLEAKTEQSGTAAIARHLGESDPTVTVLVHGEEREIPRHALRKGDLLVVAPGQRFSADGEIIEGVSVVDEAMVTGETGLRDRGPGDTVVTGAINRSGRLIVRADRVGNATVMAQIVRELRRSRGSRLSYLTEREHFAWYSVPVTLGAALLTFLLWVLYGDEPKLPPATEHAVAVLVLGFPCLNPLVRGGLTGLAGRRAQNLGVDFRNIAAFEVAAHLEGLLLDKTGTLTQGYPELSEVLTLGEFDRAEVLRLAASVQQEADHPVAQAIVRTAAAERVPLDTVTRHASAAHAGGAGVVEDRAVELRRWDWGERPALSPEQTMAVEELTTAGRAVLVLLVDQQPAGILALADPPKPEAEAAVAALHRLGLQVAMITGDSRQVAEIVAAALGVDRVIPEALPGDKANETRRLQADGQLVGVVGDGFNDAPAVAQADVGIAMAGAESLTVAAADIVLSSHDPRRVPELLALARRATTGIWQSTRVMLGLHLLLLPLALGVVPRSWGLTFSSAWVFGAAAVGGVVLLGHACAIRHWQS